MIDTLERMLAQVLCHFVGDKLDQFKLEDPSLETTLQEILSLQTKVVIKTGLRFVYGWMRRQRVRRMVRWMDRFLG